MIPTLISAVLMLCMVGVICYDASRYIIPNNLNLLLLVVYAVAVFLLPIPLTTVGSSAGAAAIMLAVGMGIFALGLMGGGDIKLLAVLTLWTGWSITTIHFLVITAILGGVLVIFVLLARLVIAPLWAYAAPTRNLPRMLTRKQPVPYGLAIAGAFLWMLYNHQIAGI